MVNVKKEMDERVNKLSETDKGLRDSVNNSKKEHTYDRQTRKAEIAVKIHEVITKGKITPVEAYGILLHEIFVLRSDVENATRSADMLEMLRGKRDL